MPLAGTAVAVERRTGVSEYTKRSKVWFDVITFYYVHARVNYTKIMV
jgi:hypothetical protein